MATDYGQTGRVPFDPAKRGALTATTQVFELKGAEIPAVITLNSTASGRAIELSTDGVNYFPTSIDTTTTNAIILRVLAKVMFMRLTGNIGDTWSVL